MAQNTSPIKLKSPEKKRKRLSVNINKCIICQKGSTDELTVGKTGKDSVRQAADVRQDEVFDRLISLDLSTKDISYHRQCFQNYTSKTNLASVVSRKQKQTSEPQEAAALLDKTILPATPITRAVRNPVDWNLCIVCQKLSHKKDRNLQNIMTKDRVNNLKAAAELRRDDVMLLRIAGLDVIASEAQYHNSCLAAYVSKTNLGKFSKPKEKKIASTSSERNEKEVYNDAFKILTNSIESDLLQNGKAFLLSSLLDMFKSYLPEEYSNTSIRSDSLKSKLLKHYGDRIAIQSQYGQGKSSIVLSSKITLKDAIKAATKLKEQLKESQTDCDSEFDILATDESDVKSLIHSAVGCLRKEMEKMTSKDYYPNAAETSLEHSEKFVPSLLYTAMLWLIDNKAYDTADPNYEPTEQIKRRSLAMAECAIYNNRKFLTPLHLGLATQLHHENGKSSIVDALNANGFSISYDELRKFITAASKHEIARSEDGIYVPDGIISVSDGGQLIHEGDDNVDINAETIDGKNTFHSMARVVFQNQQVKEQTLDSVHIPVGSDKSLKLTETECVKLTQSLPFEKPKQRQEPNRKTNAIELLNSIDCHDFDLKDIAWVLLRCMSRGVISDFGIALPDQRVPFWTGFNSMLSKKTNTVTIASYAPVIESEPADMATVYTTMRKSKETAVTLGQSHAIQTLDQQLYAIAQQVKWSMPNEMKENILRLGGFHTVCTFIACIGKIWGDGGLKDLLVDSNVYAESTVNLMLAGKQFHRAVRGITLAYECLTQLWLTAFFDWHQQQLSKGCVEVGIPEPFWQQLKGTYEALESDMQTRQRKACNLDKSISQHLAPLFGKFNEWGCSVSPTFKYWYMFLEAAEVLLLNNRAERDGLWDLHLHTTAKMMPYFFVANRNNYSRWTPLYLLDMLQLPDYIQQAFRRGNFSVRRAPGKFNGIWSDMGTETTVIRDSKGDSGIIGLTRKQPALVRWSVTRHILGNYASHMRIRNGQTAKHSEIHEQAQPAAMKRDEKHVQDIINHINNNMTNPFDADSHPEGILLNISSGLHAPQDVQQSLLSAVETGEKRFSAFVKETLSTEGKTSFYAPIARSGLKTFSDVKKKTQVITQGKTSDMTLSSELVFRRALTLSKTREEVSMKSVLTQPVTSVPTSLFHEDGSMRKTTKAELLHKLEENGPGVKLLSKHEVSSTIYIRDAMAVLQMMPGDKHASFQQLANVYMETLLHCFKDADTVVDVFDRYDNKESVKSAERERRQSACPTGRQYQVIAGRSIPPWKKFMALPENKAALNQFLSQYITERACESQALQSRHERKLVIAGGFANGKTVVCLSSEGRTESESLASTHEEADTRMILHAMDADSKFTDDDGRIVIKTPDTDVVVLALYYFPQMKHVSEFWIETGRVTKTADQRRFIPIHNISKSLGPLFCLVLPAIHALTGCDSTSALFGIGKKSVLKMIQDTGIGEFADLSELYGNDEHRALCAGRKLIASLYDPKHKAGKYHSSLNDLRFRLATTKETTLSKLPPSEASFEQHLRRASWQAKMWTHAHQSVPNIPSPVGHGWKVEHNTIIPVLFDGPVSAEVLRELVCSCRGRNICANNCVCGTNSLPCTEICPCQGDDKCQNEQNKMLVEDVEESEEVFIEDIISSRELFQGVTCECAGDTMCSEDCMCQSDGLTCTIICPCEGKEKCLNSLSHII